MTIDEARANVGSRVFYTGPSGTEYGVITTCTDTLARVLYDGDVVTQYTEPETITLVSSPAVPAP